MSETLLQIDGLHTHFKTKEGTVKAVYGVSLTLRADSVLGVVGESGAGKTMTAHVDSQAGALPGRDRGREHHVYGS